MDSTPEPLPRTFNPRAAVVTVVGPHDDENPSRTTFWGTGFFLNDRRTVVTARHVVDRYANVEHPAMVVVADSADQPVLHRVEATFMGKTLDIAVLEVEEAPNAVPLRLNTEHLDAAADIATFEYARSESFYDPHQNHAEIQTELSFHRGYVVRQYRSTYPERVPTLMYETSFPALRGASGAPVFRLPKLDVVGIIIGNRNTELQPIEKVEYHGPDGSEELVHYYLPMGRAIAAVHIQEVLTAWQTEPLTVVKVRKTANGLTLDIQQRNQPPPETDADSSSDRADG